MFLRLATHTYNTYHITCIVIEKDCAVIYYGKSYFDTWNKNSYPKEYQILQQFVIDSDINNSYQE
jgi:hypothetical protein